MYPIRRPPVMAVDSSPTIPSPTAGIATNVNSVGRPLGQPAGPPWRIEESGYEVRPSRAQVGGPIGGVHGTLGGGFGSKALKPQDDMSGMAELARGALEPTKPAQGTRRPVRRWPGG